MQPFWRRVTSQTLAQGDLIPDCYIPVFKSDFGSTDQPEEVPVSKVDLIIITQTCDLEHSKVALVALCPIHSLTAFEEANPAFRHKKRWEEVRKGRVEALHLLASVNDPENNQEALVVDFGEIFSLPFDYLTKHARELGSRWRLDSPFLEHFSQAFARFFMRVGLPSSIPPFK